MEQCQNIPAENNQAEESEKLPSLGIRLPANAATSYMFTNDRDTYVINMQVETVAIITKLLVNLTNITAGEPRGAAGDWTVLSDVKSLVYN